jgi:hypothetical protein
MKTKRTLLVAGAVSAMVLSSPLTTVFAQGTAPPPSSPLIITDLSGSVQIHQDLPCGGQLDTTQSIASGRMDIALDQVQGSTDGTVNFDLGRLDMFLTPFSVDANCMGIHAAIDFTSIGLQLANFVKFTGIPTGPPGVFGFLIPKDQFLIFETIFDNAPGVKQPEQQYKKPTEDVTGVLDLVNRTVSLRIVLASRLHFRAGCVTGGTCLIDEFGDGTQTSDIRGSGPALPPSVSCRPLSRPAGNGFLVSASDVTGPPTIMLGPFAIANGEFIQIQQTGTPGVRLVDTGRSDGTRHFQVGPGEGVIVATNTAGVSSSAFCSK